jgi:predicted O-methyltransferase YrrM
MYSPFTSVIKYARFWLKASNGKGHGTHSPFVFQFIKRILNDHSQYAAYDQVENIREALLKDKSLVEVKDLGAGSVISSGTRRSITSITRHAAKPRKWGQLIFRIVKYYQPRNILELGTSLGITSAYLSLGDEHATLTTIEGSPAIAARARLNLDHLGIKNATILTGNFDQLLPELLENANTWDLVFIDGNHRMEPTLRYFHWIIERSGPGTIIIFDDIHWSKEMEEAWQQIKKDPRVRCSIDLFFIGLVFFREEFKEKLEFSVRC